MALAFDRIIAIIIILFSALVMEQWLVNPDDIANICTVFATALSSMLVAITFIIPDNRPLLQSRIRIGCGLIVVILAGLNFFQNISGTSLGMNHYQLYLGQMAPQTAICFIGYGLLLIGLHQKGNRIANIVIQSTIILIMILAIIGLTGAIIRLELLYDWFHNSRVTVPTESTILLLSIASWIYWYRREAIIGGYLERQEKRIGVTAIVIIIVSTLTAGMAGFGIMLSGMQHVLEVTLQRTFVDRMHMISDQIQMNEDSTEHITSSILMQLSPDRINHGETTIETREIVQKYIENFDMTTMNAMSIYDHKGERVAQLHDMAKSPELSMPIATKIPHAEMRLLLWHGNILLHIKHDIGKYGTLIVEYKLPHVRNMLTHNNFMVTTNVETLLCGAVDTKFMQCMPTASNPLVKHAPRFTSEHRWLMDYALNSQSGIMTFRDPLESHNKEIITVYGPLVPTGLALAITMDTNEFYTPLRDELTYALLMVLAVALAGIILQRLQLMPLVSRLIESEHEAVIVSEKLSIYVEELEKAKAKAEEAIDQLAISNSELERFAYICSHDLQEPLRTISSFTEILQKRLHDQIDQKTQHYMNFIIEGANRARTLINDVLHYARIGQENEKYDWVDIATVIDDIKRNLATVIEETSAMISYHGDANIKINRTHIMQLLQNLITNAIKFRGDKAAEITISVTDLGDAWQFALKDNGIGIEDEYKEKIFEIFQRLHKRTEYPGTGIGLAVCKKIVEQYGGRIWVESTIGSGSCFYFTIIKEGSVS